MKTRMSLLILVLLVLPLVLAACGGGPAGEAKAFLEASSDGDKDEAAKHVCDKNKDTLTEGIGEGDSDTKAEDIECEEDGDDVKCTMTLKQGDEEEKVTMTFGMEDGKVCELKNLE